MMTLQLIQRVEFRGTAAQLRANAGIDRSDEVAAIDTCSEIGAAARRLRLSNTFVDTTSAAEVAAPAAHLVAQVDNRAVAGKADSARRRSALAGRASSLLTDLAAVRDEALKAAGSSAPRRPMHLASISLAGEAVTGSVSVRVRDRLEDRRAFRAATGSLRTAAAFEDAPMTARVPVDPTVASAARRLRASVAA